MSPLGARGPNEALIGEQGSRAALSTPALVLDLDRLERNIAYLAAYLGKAGHGLRPVAKIHKSMAVARLQAEAGALGQCCATLAEAEVMADAGIPGVLLFSQVVTAPKIARLARLNARADGLLVAVDDAAVADRLAAGCAGGRPAAPHAGRSRGRRPAHRSRRGGRRAGAGAPHRRDRGRGLCGCPGLQRLVPAGARLRRPQGGAGALHGAARRPLRASRRRRPGAGDRLRRRHRTPMRSTRTPASSPNARPAATSSWT